MQLRFETSPTSMFSTYSPVTSCWSFCGCMANRWHSNLRSYFPNSQSWSALDLFQQKWYEFFIFPHNHLTICFYQLFMNTRKCQNVHEAESYLSEHALDLQSSRLFYRRKIDWMDSGTHLSTITENWATEKVKLFLTARVQNNIDGQLLIRWR